MLGLDEAAAATLRARIDRRTSAYVILAPRPRPAMSTGSGPHRGTVDSRASASSRAGPGLPAGGRRSGLDAGRPPARVRESRRRRPVRGRAVLPGRSRGSPRIAWRSATRRARRPRTTATSTSGYARARTSAHDRRRPPARGRAGAPGGMDRGPGQERVGDRHGPVHRRGLRRGDVPVVRRQRLPGDRRRRPVSLHRPGRLSRLRARLGVQDDDRGGGPRGGHRHARHADQGHRHAAARQGRTKVDDADRRAMGWMRSRTPSPIRATSSRPRSRSGWARRPQAGRDHPPRQWHTGVRHADRDRPRGRGPGLVNDPAITPGARSTSPTARSARASRSPRSSSRRRTPRW